MAGNRAGVWNAEVAYSATEPRETGRAGVQVVCPVCSFEYVHIAGEPENIKGYDGYKAGWGGRGDLVRIPFKCENGHSWLLCFGLHKGNTSCWVEDYS